MHGASGKAPYAVAPSCATRTQPYPTLQPAGRGQAAPASPVKARFASPDSSELITVVASEASKVRPTFLQARPPHCRVSHVLVEHARKCCPASEPRASRTHTYLDLKC